MATIKQHSLSNGRKSYTIQVKYKDRFISTTWRRPEWMKENECKRQLEQISSDFEKQVRNDIDTKNNHITFEECSNQWLHTCESCNSKTYYFNNIKIVQVLNEIFGKKMIKDINARDINNFILYLNQKEFVVNKAKLIHSLDEKIKSYKIKDICEKCNFTKTTFQFVRQGKIVELSIAESICKFLNISFKDYFQKFTTAKKYELESKLKYKRTLSSIFSLAMENEYINKNYVSLIFKNSKLTGQKNEKTILNETETQELIRALKKELNIKKRLAVTILLYMGLRIGELSGLEWQDIDFVNRTMHIRRSTSFLPKIGEITKTPKTKSSIRVLDMPTLVYDMLCEYKLFYDKERDKLGNLWNDRNRIICQWNGLPTTSGTFSNWLTDILIKNGIRKVSPHSLRHTCITNLLRNNVPPQIVSKWAGHSSTTVTLNTYAHFLPEDKSVCANVLDKIFT